jgi:long-chain acyl-CoA synthetase
VVIGDRRKFLSALIALDPDAARKFAADRGFEGAPHEMPAIIDEVQKAVDEVNSTLARVESIKKFKLVPKPFSIEAGELTPTLKLKRKAVNKNYAAEIEAMYQE